MSSDSDGGTIGEQFSENRIEPVRMGLRNVGSAQLGLYDEGFAEADTVDMPDETQ